MGGAVNADVDVDVKVVKSVKHWMVCIGIGR